MFENIEKVGYSFFKFQTGGKKLDSDPKSRMLIKIWELERKTTAEAGIK
jgi:hypothetical protein